MKMKKSAFGVLSIFGSEYLCKQVLSSMIYIKSRYHSTSQMRVCSLKIKVTSYSLISEDLQFYNLINATKHGIIVMEMQSSSTK
ncbi:hypothetical protein LDENG_00198170 [Lucifuga dentata]|nr:hypothetical protein LDENG_00198170 [Lucifuga dentata]